MSSIQLVWDDPALGERRAPILELPIALGREFNRMPATIADRRVCRIVLSSDQVSRYHALIDQMPASPTMASSSGSIVIWDQNSMNGILVNGQRQTEVTLLPGDQVQIGPYLITLQIPAVAAGAASGQEGVSTILFHPETDRLTPEIAPELSPIAASFPPPLFQAQQVAVAELASLGLPLWECDYGTIGAGLASFVWVDVLRMAGVSCDRIQALGIEAQPYARYQRLCANSQIPAHERLRSNSDSCPDNIWGFPSYAWREAWHDLGRGQIGPALTHLWKVFAEPAAAETYTPRAGRVFASLEREAQRIGWPEMFRYGRARAIRKTQDGRYCIAFSRSTSERRDHAFLIARHVHLGIGYPAIQFLPDLQDYRQSTGDFHRVVNAYEPHDHVYTELEQQGGTVMIRGRGIVASRILQRLAEARQRNSQIAVLHLLRSPKAQGNRFRRSQRRVINHQELQPFNWPKACWGGELRLLLEQASPEQRLELLAAWGGTTTANRQDWQQIVATGLQQGWYQIAFGVVEKVQPNAQGRPVTTICDHFLRRQVQFQADFVIDATGLDARPQVNPLLKDLVEHYQLPLNGLGRLLVANDFEVTSLRHQTGRFYAAGAITLGGPYAAVDSFLGLQYAALMSLTGLVRAGAPGVHSLNSWRSCQQWLKWALNQPP